MPPFNRNEVVQTLARVKGAIKIKVGPDISDILGMDSGLSDAVIASTLSSRFVENSLEDVGSIESLDIMQTRDIRPRYGFGPNPQEPFQTVPLNLSITLRASKVMLKKMGKAESVFNFTPNNLKFQQAPFIIQIRDKGGFGDPGMDNSEITHYIFGCWFSSSTTRYDATQKDDTRVLQNVEIKCGRVLTFDGSSAGSVASTLTRSVFGGILAIPGAQETLSNFPLS